MKQIRCPLSKVRGKRRRHKRLELDLQLAYLSRLRSLLKERQKTGNEKMLTQVRRLNKAKRRSYRHILSEGAEEHLPKHKNTTSDGCSLYSQRGMFRFSTLTCVLLSLNALPQQTRGAKMRSATGRILNFQGYILWGTQVPNLVVEVILK